MSRQAFPLEFQRVIILQETDYAHLSKAMARRGYRLSKQFIGQIAAGKRNVPPLQLRRICETLTLVESDRKTLALAACRDMGYEV